jgi:hypothetical protein
VSGGNDFSGFLGFFEEVELNEAVFGDLEGPRQKAGAVEQQDCGRLPAGTEAFAAEGIAFL